MDLTIHNACFLDANALRVADIGVAGGSIVAIESGLKTDARKIDASGCLVVPGHRGRDRRRSGQADRKRKT
jgi:dihydroorotase-like cyclic amidohydrolase